MNFTNRDNSTQSSSLRNNQGAAPSIAGPLNGLKPHHARKGSDWIKGTWAIMLVSLTIIVLSLVYLLHIANPNEGKYVAGGKLQAVFLQNGQVYFGQIKTVSQKYIDLQNIFYLNNSSTSGSSSSSSNNNLSLVKLGCELHGPYDEMIINADQVTFWENLRPDGQVAKAVAQYQKQNPKGQTCSQSSQSSTTQSTGATQSATTPQSSTTTKQ